MITSVDNARVKAARALSRPRRRRETGLCLLEGVRLIETAFAAGADITEVFVGPPADADERALRLVATLRDAGVPVVSVNRRVLDHISETEHSQGIIATAPMAQTPPNEFRGVSALLIADRIGDPGNVGTMARTAAATGSGMWTTIGSTDLYDPKSLRAAVGTTFLVPHRQRLSPVDVIAHVRRFGHQLIVADAQGALDYYAADWRRPFALVIGNEAHGVDEVFLDAADMTVRIPLQRGVESLNAAVTAAVCLFEAVRRRASGDGQTPSPRL